MRRVVEDGIQEERRRSTTHDADSLFWVKGLRLERGNRGGRRYSRAMVMFALLLVPVVVLL